MIERTSTTTVAVSPGASSIDRAGVLAVARQVLEQLRRPSCSPRRSAAAAAFGGLTVSGVREARRPRVARRAGGVQIVVGERVGGGERGGWHPSIVRLEAAPAVQHATALTHEGKPVALGGLVERAADRRRASAHCNSVPTPPWATIATSPGGDAASDMVDGGDDPRLGDGSRFPAVDAAAGLGEEAIGGGLEDVGPRKPGGRPVVLAERGERVWRAECNEAASTTLRSALHHTDAASHRERCHACASRSQARPHRGTGTSGSTRTSGCVMKRTAATQRR